jgi:hypothetical protein
MSDSYFVVACKNCKNAWIVSGVQETTSCTLCNNTYKFKQMKKMYETPDKEEAKEALTLKQAQLNGLEDVYNEMVEEVDFSRDVMEQLVPEKDGELLDTYETETREDAPSNNKEWVLRAVNELDSPSDEDVVEWVKGRTDISEEVVFEILDALCIEGEIIRKRGGELEVV